MTGQYAFPAPLAAVGTPCDDRELPADLVPCLAGAAVKHVGGAR